MARNTGASTVKLYYRIGEVAGIVGVEPHVLRYWETEFPSIRPQKSRSGQRVYSRRDVDKLLRVKELLYAQRFTIAGARQRLKEGGGHLEPPSPPAPEAPDSLESAAPEPRASVERDHGEVARDTALRLRAALLDVRCDVLRVLQGLAHRSRRLGRETDTDFEEADETLSGESPVASRGPSAGSHNEGIAVAPEDVTCPLEPVSARSPTRFQARDDSDAL
ncbi:MAG: MerR family transcriptional regulator [Polyangiaceae bacterium]